MRRISSLVAATTVGLCLAAAAGCGPGSFGRSGGLDMSASEDNFDLFGVPEGSDLAGLGSKDAMGPCDDQTNPCPKGQRCYMAACIPDNGTCVTDNDCQNDSYCVCKAGGGDMGACMGGVCLPYGTGPRGLFDPECHSAAFSPSDFVAPQLKCKWDPGMQGGALMTPIVADLDGDGKPEVIIESYGGAFTAIHGTDCTPYFQKTFGFAANGQSQLAVADLDGDKVPEIVGVDASARVVVFDNKGNLIATSPTPYKMNGVAQDWGGPAIVDVDNTAPPEIVVAAQVLRYANKSLSVLWTNTADLPFFGGLSVAADMDGDGKAEVITGKQVFDGITGADKTPSALKALTGIGGYPAIGDFNADGHPDIVLVQSGSQSEVVSIFDFFNNKFIFGPFTLAEQYGGPPTVADFDGDGKPEFATAGRDYYYVFDTKCAVMNKPKYCDQTSNLGVRWRKKTQDHSSGATGSSVFDFNGDGIAEVVYRDECWLRVYNGPDGKVLFAANVTSATALELPVVADLDNDGHAKIVTTSDSFVPGLCPKTPEPDTNTPWTGQTSGIYIYQDPMNRWMPSRAIWNEHSYHITNVNDDVTVPTSEKDNWKTWNNYRQNTQGQIKGMAMPQVDFTGGMSSSIDNGGADCKNSERLWAKVCNRGTAVSKPGIAAAFYDADPRKPGAKVLCTTMTKTALKPGDCEAVFCDWKNPPSMPQDLWFRTDDDGMGNHPQSECKNGNDLLFMPNTQCFIPG